MKTDLSSTPTSLSAQILKLIARIPKGKVATYGQLASLAGNPKAARLVAWLLHSSTEKRKLPWHRVINSQGRISLPMDPHGYLQIGLLKKERVVMNDKGVYDLEACQWKPRVG